MICSRQLTQSPQPCIIMSEQAKICSNEYMHNNEGFTGNDRKQTVASINEQHLQQIRKTFEALENHSRIQTYSDFVAEQINHATEENEVKTLQFNLHILDLICSEQKRILNHEYEKLIISHLQNQNQSLEAYQKTSNPNDMIELKLWENIRKAESKTAIAHLIETHHPTEYPLKFLDIAENLIQSTQDLSLAVKSLRLYREQNSNVVSPAPLELNNNPELLSGNLASSNCIITEDLLSPNVDKLIEEDVSSIHPHASKQCVDNEIQTILLTPQIYGPQNIEPSVQLQASVFNDKNVQPQTFHDDFKANSGESLPVSPFESFNSIHTVESSSEVIYVEDLSHCEIESPHVPAGNPCPLDGNPSEGVTNKNLSQRKSDYNNGLNKSQKRRRLTHSEVAEHNEVNKKNVENSKIDSLAPSSPCKASLCHLFQQLDVQLNDVASIIADDASTTMGTSSTTTTTADFATSSSSEICILTPENDAFFSQVKMATSALSHNNHNPEKKKSRRTRGRASHATKRTEEAPHSSEMETALLLDQINLLSSEEQSNTTSSSLCDNVPESLPSLCVYQQIKGVPVTFEMLSSEDFHVDSIYTGIEVTYPITLIPSIDTHILDDNDTEDDAASITFGTRKGRGPLTPESREAQIAAVGVANSAVIQFVYECLTKSEGIFTMKSKIYQTRLKAYLPRPETDNQQRYILSITKPPLIPANVSELHMIDHLRTFDDSTAPRKRIQNSGCRVADLLEDFLTSLVNKMMLLLVVEHHTWYIHAPAREQLTKHLLQFIWPNRPIIQNNFRTFFLNFVEVRIRHFRDSVARHFREKAKHREYNTLPYSCTTVRSTRSRSALSEKKRSVEITASAGI